MQRNQQVPLMGQIYSCARSTIIYLGDESEAVKGLVEGDQATRNLEAVLEDIVERPWFTRTWVFQEHVLSVDPWIQLGRQRIRWREICKLLPPMMTDSAAPTRYNALQTSRKHVLRQMEMVRSSGTDRTLLNILKLRAGCRASDPRDVIFAHMGMITDEKDVSKYLKVDYNASIREVYTSAARYALASFGLGVAARSINRPQGLTHLPSWVPDWGLHAWLGDLPRSTFQDLLAVDGDCLTSVIVTPTTNPSPHNFRVPGSSYPWSGPFQHIHCVSRLLPQASETGLQDQLLLEVASVRSGERRVPDERVEDAGGSFFPHEFWSPPHEQGTLAEKASYIRHLLKLHYYPRSRALGFPDMRIAISRSGYCALVPGDAQPGDVITNCRKDQYGYFLGEKIFGCSGDRRTKLLSCLFRPLTWEGDKSVEDILAKITGYPGTQISATHCVLVGILGETEMQALPLDLRMAPGDINWLVIH